MVQDEHKPDRKSLITSQHGVTYQKTCTFVYDLLAPPIFRNVPELTVYTHVSSSPFCGPLCKNYVNGCPITLLKGSKCRHDIFLICPWTKVLGLTHNGMHAYILKFVLVIFIAFRRVTSRVFTTGPAFLSLQGAPQ
jgi:hypothetical protein